MINVPVLKKLRKVGSSILEETKKDLQAMKKQYPKAKDTVRRARRGYGKFMKGAKKAHGEGRKIIKEFQESLPKVPDDYFDEFINGPKKKKRR